MEFIMVKTHEMSYALEESKELYDYSDIIYLHLIQNGEVIKNQFFYTKEIRRLRNKESKKIYNVVTNPEVISKKDFIDLVENFGELEGELDVEFYFISNLESSVNIFRSPLDGNHPNAVVVSEAYKSMLEVTVGFDKRFNHFSSYVLHDPDQSNSRYASYGLSVKQKTTWWDRVRTFILSFLNE